jgi:hypothetical protein
MKQNTYILITTLIIFLTLNSLTASADTPTTIERQEITINLIDKGLSLEEKLTYRNTINSNITIIKFSIPQDASQIDIITTTGDKFLISPVDDTIYEINLSENNIQLIKDSTIDLQLSYSLPTNTETFQKTTVYDTNYLSIEFNNKMIYQGENIKFDENLRNSLSLTLYRPTEAPLSLTTLIIIFSLVVIIILIMILVVRRKRSPTTKSENESKEVLDTKKALYLSILKDIEKQHRGKQISDETYSKIKAEFKQQAVTVMQKLENIAGKK